MQKGWYHKDTKATSPTTLSNKRFYSMGLLGNGTLYYRFYDKANTKNYVDFLRHAYGEHDRMIIFTDNASIHKSKALMDFLGEMDDRIRIHCFPPYTPELNPVEPQWKVHKKATGNRIYENVEEMQESLRTMRERKEIPVVKMSAYLAR